MPTENTPRITEAERFEARTAMIEEGQTYRDSLTCDECGCFQSKHDDQCSQWSEPLVLERLPSGEFAWLRPVPK